MSIQIKAVLKHLAILFFNAGFAAVIGYVTKSWPLAFVMFGSGTASNVVTLNSTAPKNQAVVEAVKANPAIAVAVEEHIETTK